MNKEIAKRLQEHLNAFGYEVKVTHVYEVLSKLSGYKTWNIAKAKKVDFAKTLGLNVEQDSSDIDNNPTIDDSSSIYDIGYHLGESYKLKRSVVLAIQESYRSRKLSERTSTFFEPWFTRLGEIDPSVATIFKQFPKMTDSESFFNGFFQALVERDVD